MSAVSSDPVTPPPRWLLLLLALATLAQVAAFAWFIPGVDFIRDLQAVLSISNGEWPLRGPVINEAMYLGPLWFYVLAIPYALGLGLTGTVLFIGALSMLKVPLAWRLGMKLQGPWLAACFATLILLPGWNVLFAILFTHTVMVEALLLATWFPLLALWRGGGSRQWLLFGALSGLALHGHPVAVVLAVPAAIVAWRRRAQWRADLWPMLAGVGLALLPFVPMLYIEAREGWPMLASLQAATERPSESLVVSAWHLPFALLAGPWQILHLWLPGAQAWVAGMAGVIAAIGALLGLPTLWRDPALRRNAAITLGALLLGLILLAIVRQRTPFYMATLVLPPLVMLLALPLAALANSTRRGRCVALTVLVSVLVGAGALALGHRAVARDGHAVLPLSIIFDVKNFQVPLSELAMAPVHALDTLADAHCGKGPLVVHGELAAMVDIYQAVPFRWHCPDIDIRVMGQYPQATHWAGTTPYALERLGHGRRSWQEAANWQPARILKPEQGVTPTVRFRYPPRDVLTDAPQPLHYDFEAAADEAISVFSPLFPYDTATTPEARCNGEAVVPRMVTDAGALFLPPGDTGCHWDVRLQARAPGRVDIVTLTFDRAGIAR